MYRYDALDRRLVEERVAQFRDQTARYLAGKLSADDYKPLRLQNGLYEQRHAPMLRVAIPYGMLSSAQLRVLARIAREFDRGYGHFTTRQNIQYNWVKIEETPDILALLASVEMHAIQTSGNCVRNVTTDHFAGIAPDEVVDPRPYCELMRQWSTLNPEFAYLPRKFKVAFNGAREDRAATSVHDLAFDVYRNGQGEVRLRVKVGGGQGRTPRLAVTIREDLPWQEMLNYSEAILRAYNRWGRRDNLYKARIKILVEALGAEKFAKEVEADFAYLEGGPGTLTQEELDRVSAFFVDPPYRDDADAALDSERARHPRFKRWLERNVSAHKRPGYAAVTLSFKKPGIAPGDATADQLDAAAGLAERYSFGEARVTHYQNLVLSDVARRDLFALWLEVDALGLAEANTGLAGDLIACPGGDFCALANARSIPLAESIQQRLAPIQDEIGDLAIKISGCINSCGHHHVGHIGVLGVDKNGEEWYQILVGGRSDTESALGQILGKSVALDEVAPLIERLVHLYLQERKAAERFIDTAARIGIEPFKQAAYPATKPALESV
jgi:sulfite reductase (NADPH) hemoprotein beta-component